MTSKYEQPIPGIDVQLTVPELHEAYLGAWGRKMAARARGLKPGSKTKRFEWDNEIRGACGELVVCKVLGIPWDPTIDRYDAPDAGPFQVRTTYLDNGCLILRGKELWSQDTFILVTGHMQDYVVRGWLTGSAGNRQKWFQDINPEGLPAYFVPQSALMRPAPLLRAAQVGIYHKVQPGRVGK